MFNIKRVYQWLSLAGLSPTENKQSLVHDLIEEERLELLDAQKNNNREEMLDAYVDLFWVVTNGLFFDGFTLEQFENHCKKVESQNFSKFCKTEEEALQTIELYKNGKHPNKIGDFIDCYYIKVGDFYPIFRKNDNKLLKSMYYVES